MPALPPIFRGDDAAFLLTVLDSTGAPVDITGDDVEFEVKATLNGADPALIRKTVGAGIALLAQSGATLGQARVTLLGTDTDIAPRAYWADVVHTKAGIRTHVVRPTILPIASVVNQR